MKNIRSNKGFTLVEIMIVVVIIGLLAAMAIPAFQKVRTSSLEKTVLNDARQLGSAAQQYFLEKGANEVEVTIDSTNGKVTGPLTDYVKTISKNITFTGSNGTAGTDNIESDGTFALSLNGAFPGNTTAGKQEFDAEGKAYSQ